MDEATKNIFHASLARCNQHGDFFKRFYEIFMASSVEVKEVFKNTDMQKQVKMLRDSFYATKLASSDSAIIKANLQKIALAHSKREPKVRPEHFDLWLQSLIQTVLEFDAQYDMEIAAAWKAMMKPGIDYLKAPSITSEELIKAESAAAEFKSSELSLAAFAEK
jgi:hemoglobin-like flavoprotein